MKRTLTAVVIGALAAIAVMAAVQLARAEPKTKHHGINMPKFDRPLVVDKKLEAEVNALKGRVATLESDVAALKKQIAKYAPPPRK